MGWGAQATREGELIAIATRYQPDRWSIEDLPLREVFEQAAQRVQNRLGVYPEALANAALSGARERSEFERLLGIRCADFPAGEFKWSASEVRSRVATIDWTTPEDPALEIWTVKEFIGVCTEHRLGIWCGW